MSTPFPDGICHMDIVWSSLTTTQRDALVGKIFARAPTYRVLRAYGLMDERNRLTARGRALLEWVVESGSVDTS